MNLKSRIEKLEEEHGLSGEELIVCLRRFYQIGEQPPDLPDPEKEIARQRAEGKRVIVVEVPEQLPY